MIKQGLIQIYTGHGKGKTTASLGLAVRAAGHGNFVLFAQFLKPGSLDTGELKTIENIRGITVETVNDKWDMRQSLNDQALQQQVTADIAAFFERIIPAAADKVYNIIILDEVVFCLRHSLVSIDVIRELIDKRHPDVEIVMTGRDAVKELVEIADLVTEMRMVKHPFEKDINARRGIEY